MNVGYYSSSGSDGDFVGCESKSASEAEDEAEAPVDDDSSGTEQSDDDTIRCGLCEGELVELADTEEIGECDSCQRQLTRDEVTLSCPRRNCEWDVCLPCAGRSRASRQTATLPPPPPDALSASPRAVDATAVPAAPAARATPTIPAAPAVPAASAYRAAFVAPLTIRERLQRMGFRARDPVPREDPFLRWQAERAAARRTALGLDAPEGGGAAGAAANGAAGDTTGDGEGGAEGSAEGGAEDGAAGSCATARDPTTATPPTSYVLSAPVTITLWPEARVPMPEQVSDVIATGGAPLSLAVSFARELFRQLPTESLPQAADSVYGQLTDAALAGVEEQPRSNAPPQQFGVAIPTQLALANVTDRRRCFCCDADFGNGDSNGCAALQLYDTLLEAMHERDAIIEQELGNGDGADLAHLNRAARWFMYRTFVAARYGHLGAGVRIQIPDCVVAAIRSRYREPSCNCHVRDIGTCTAHGYTGYRAS